MSVVTYFVETSQGYLDTAAETQFGSVAATVGTLLVLGTTLVVILVFLNMIYQYKAMDGRTAFTGYSVDQIPLNFCGCFDK